MTFDDLKIYGLNSITMAISFSNVESTLKILLLCVSIVYTVMKTIELIKNRSKNGSDNT